jgi:hypothetical protein
MFLLNQLIRVAYIGIDQVEGCVFDAAHNKWIQNAPAPQKIVVHVSATNQLSSKLDSAVIAATWVYNGIEPLRSANFELKPFQSHSVSFAFDPLSQGLVAALYLHLFETNPAWNPNQKPEEVAQELFLRFEGKEHWANILRQVGVPRQAHDRVSNT